MRKAPHKEGKKIRGKIVKSNNFLNKILYAFLGDFAPIAHEKNGK